MSSVLEVKNLTKQFGKGDDRVIAVDDLSFAVDHGETVALLGGNGAGKTTTIAMILGLVLPTAGDITVLGHDMLRHPARALPFMNFESPYVDLPHRLSVAQNLKVFARLYGVRDISGRLNELSEGLDLAPLMKRQVGQLSAGQKTRVALAKSLINRPKLLLLDEPTASLDPDTADWVRSYLQNYCRTEGATLFLASHNMGEVERMADQVLMMKQGRVVATGAPADLIAQYGRANMEEVFLDIARGHGEVMPD